MRTLTSNQKENGLAFWSQLPKTKRQHLILRHQVDARLASFPWGGADLWRHGNIWGETSMEGELLAPAKPWPPRLDGILLESWKAAETPRETTLECARSSLATVSFRFFGGCFGLSRVNSEQKGKGLQPA